MFFMSHLYFLFLFFPFSTGDGLIYMYIEMIEPLNPKQTESRRCEITEVSDDYYTPVVDGS